MVDSKCRVPGATLERGSIGRKNIIVRPLAQSFLVYLFEKICAVLMWHVFAFLSGLLKKITGADLFALESRVERGTHGAEPCRLRDKNHEVKFFRLRLMSLGG